MIRIINVGRVASCDIVLLDQTVSGKHCKIFIINKEAFICDLQSKNGTYLNGRKVKISKLCKGDIVKVGQCRFVFDNQWLRLLVE